MLTSPDGGKKGPKTLSQRSGAGGHMGSNPQHFMLKGSIAARFEDVPTIDLFQDELRAQKWRLCAYLHVLFAPFCAFLGVFQCQKGLQKNEICTEFYKNVRKAYLLCNARLVIPPKHNPPLGMIGFLLDTCPLGTKQGMRSLSV